MYKTKRRMLGKNVFWINDVGSIKYSYKNKPQLTCYIICQYKIHFKMGNRPNYKM